MKYPNETRAEGIVIGEPMKMPHSENAAARLRFPLLVSQWDPRGVQGDTVQPSTIGVAVEEDLFPGSFEQITKGQYLVVLGTLKTVEDGEAPGQRHHELIGKEVSNA